MKAIKTTDWLGAGVILIALASSVCCILPVVVVVLGLGSATLAAVFEPFRPYLLALTALLLGIAFYQVYHPGQAACSREGDCVDHDIQSRRRIFVWIVAALAMALITFPYYVGWLI